MIPAAKERLNLSNPEKWVKERMPAMIPAKHDIDDRIMKALVAFQYADNNCMREKKNKKEDKIKLAFFF